MSSKVLSCVDFVKFLNDYVDFNVSKKESLLIDKHLNDCESCKVKVVNIVQVKKMIKSTYGTGSHVIDVRSKVMSKLRDRENVSVRSDSKVDLSYKIMSKVTDCKKQVNMFRFSLPAMENYKFLSIAVAMIFVITATIVYSQSESKKLMAARSKIESYAVEHSSTAPTDYRATMDSMGNSITPVNFNE